MVENIYEIVDDDGKKHDMYFIQGKAKKTEDGSIEKLYTLYSVPGMYMLVKTDKDGNIIGKASMKELDKIEFI